MSDNILRFPYPDHTNRLDRYEHYQRLFDGDHFEAFNIKIRDEDYTKTYSKLRYIAANFAGLISKVMADFLFSEPAKFKVDDGDQDFLDALVHENNLQVQNYESALSNSYLGDAVYKLRIGKRNSNDLKPTVIIEDITPTIYFPHSDFMNVRANPEKEEIAWVFEHASKQYLYKEIQTPGLIEYHIYEMVKDKIMAEVDPKSVGLDLPESEETLIDRNLIIHIPNWKTGKTRFGISDYYDLDSLFYSINNRITKIDNILDKHSDPILAIPEGILDEEGKVKRENLALIEIPDGVDRSAVKPEYIVWNANLDSAINEVDKLIELLFMVSETSPDILGMGKGVSDSGRALKLKLIRTMAKAQRKRLYYDRGLKEVLYVAQLLAKAHNIEVGGFKLKGEAVYPEIEWFDGLPVDQVEQVDVESKRIDAGLTTTKDAIMRIDGVDEEIAEIKVQEIKSEDQIELPNTDVTPNE
jgi:hypothetical protein